VELAGIDASAADEGVYQAGFAGSGAGSPTARARPKQSARVSGVKLWDSSAAYAAFFIFSDALSPHIRCRYGA